MLSWNIKIKPKKISRSSFACWELSRINSFSRSCSSFLRKTKTPKIFQCVSLKFFSFLWGPRGEDHDENDECSHMHYCWSNKEPILPCLLLWINVCRFQLSPMHMHYYYYPHRLVVQVKGNNDDIWWGKAGMNSTYLVFVNMISSSFLIQPIIVRDYSYSCH